MPYASTITLEGSIRVSAILVDHNIFRKLESTSEIDNIGPSSLVTPQQKIDILH